MLLFGSFVCFTVCLFVCFVYFRGCLLCVVVLLVAFNVCVLAVSSYCLLHLTALADSEPNFLLLFIFTTNNGHL